MRRARNVGVDKTELIDILMEYHSPKDLTKYTGHGMLAAFIEGVSEHPSFAEQIETVPKLRLLVRDVHPEMLQPFRPHREDADLQELGLIIEESHILHTAVQNYIRKTYKKSSVKHLNKEDAEQVIEIAKNLLIERNEENAPELIARTNKWNLLRHFNQYWEELNPAS